MRSASEPVEPAGKGVILSPFAQENIAAWRAIFRGAAPRIGHDGEHQSPSSVDGEQGIEGAAGPESSALHEVLLQVCMPFIKQMLLALQRTLEEEVLARAEFYKMAGKSPRDEAEGDGAFEKNLSASSGAGPSDGDQAFGDEFRQGASRDPGMAPPGGRASVSRVQKAAGAMNSVLPEGFESDESEAEQPYTPHANPMPYLRSPSMSSVTSNAPFEELVPFEDRLMQALQRSDAVGQSSSEGAGGGSRSGVNDQSNMVCRHWYSKGWCRLMHSCRFLHPIQERGAGRSRKRSKPRRRSRDALAPGLVDP
eukprot:TRINITY_DN211_c0_g4_i1.p1 TRINITY_DN211_c0_g4~~TRINITY_DN211_c0_g4_i1.p1  ORF type:complete len:309 (+),score=43.67 TRINITY_DN211_c0_g4_i1:128-1054(+)